MSTCRSEIFQLTARYSAASSSSASLIGEVLGGIIIIIFIAAAIALIRRYSRLKKNKTHAIPATRPAVQNCDEEIPIAVIKPWNTSDYDIVPRSFRTETAWNNERILMKSAIYIPEPTDISASQPEYKFDDFNFKADHQHDTNV